MNTRYVMLALGMTVTAAPAAPAPQPADVPTITRQCDGCTVSVRRILTLSSQEPAAVELKPMSVIRNHRGDLILFAGRGKPRVQVFSSDGLSRGLLAREGQGPGELRRPTWVLVGDDDSLRVYDTGRMLVFGPSLRFVRESSMRPAIGGTIELARLRNGITMHVPSGGGLGTRQRLRLRRVNGDTITTVTLPDTIGWAVTYELASGRAGIDAGAWIVRGSADSAGYRVSWVDTTGRLSTRFRRVPQWWYRTEKPEPVVTWNRGPTGAFVPSRDSSDLIPRRPSALTDVRQSKEGLLYVLFSHASENWKGVTLRNIASSGMTSTVLEIVDPVSLRVIGTARASGFPVGLVDDETFATYRVEADGNFHIDLWSITVVRPR